MLCQKGTNEASPNSKTVRPSLCVCVSEDPEEEWRKKVLLIPYWCLSVYNGFYISDYTLKGRGRKKLWEVIQLISWVSSSGFKLQDPEVT